MSSAKTQEALLRRGYDETLIHLLLAEGHTVSSLKTADDKTLADLGLSVLQIQDIRRERRPEIAKETLHKLLFESKRTCCVCRTPNQPVVIHHIHEWNDSRNHAEENLAVLCVNCHDKAHTKKQLSLALKPEEIVACKQRWIASVKSQDADAIAGKSDFLDARWDYVNLSRFFEIYMDFTRRGNRVPVDKALYDQLLEENLIHVSGVLSNPSSWRGGPPSSYLFNFGSGHLLAYYLKNLLHGVVAELPIRDITSHFNRTTVKSSLHIGDYISLEKGFYFRALTRKSAGRGQLREAYYKKNKLKITFTFDAYESTSSSAKNCHLVGHNVITPICRILSIIEEDTGEIVITCSCLAIGGGFHPGIHDLLAEAGLLR